LSETFGFGFRAGVDVADEHAEALVEIRKSNSISRYPKTWGGKTYGLEGLDFGHLLEIVQAVLHVVDSHATVNTIEAAVRDLRYTLVGAISCFEVPAFM
jgi:hypothetical protein